MIVRAPRTLLKAEWPPDYSEVYAWRLKQLKKLREDMVARYGAMSYYASNPWDFINHWCDTYDPRNALQDLPTRLPFIQFEQQELLLRFLYDCLTQECDGLVDKSRDMGATWDCCGFSVWLWRFHPGAAVGWGSRKKELVDQLGVLDSIFEKMRQLIYGLPKLFWPKGFIPLEHMTYMRILNPENGASITGEVGDNIGRGGRKSIYFKDESAHYERPEAIEAALGDNTRVQIDISSPKGVGTVFDRKREAGIEWKRDTPLSKTRTNVFILDWTAHPMKTQDWHQTREQKFRSEGLLHVFRQEVDRDPSASVQGIIIPHEWVRSAVDAHIKLKWPTSQTAPWMGALDVADEGGDLNALTMRQGVILRYVEDWGEGDTGFTTRRTIAITRTRAPITISYDACGVGGGGVKAEYNRLSKEKDSKGAPLIPPRLWFVPWDAGAAVLKPEERVIPGDKESPLNKDYFANLKAQAWWALRMRFYNTHRWVAEGIKAKEEDCISLDSKIEKLPGLIRELSQPVMTQDGKLRMLVDKRPEGTRSPDKGDSVMMNYFPAHTKVVISRSLLEWSAQR